MADYHFPTVVQPSIPASAISPLERLILCEIFEFESDGDAFYFFSSEGPANTVYLYVKQLQELLDDTAPPSALTDCVRRQLEFVKAHTAAVEIDLSDLGEAAIFQEIVRRCAELDRVTITAAWTCTRMRPDGFGGGITVVTADHILSSSTAQMECELLDRAAYGELGRAPGHGSHVLLRLGETDVRQAVLEIAELGPLTAASGPDVSDGDIRAACFRTAEAADLAVHHEALVEIAARVAIEIARQRAN